MYACLATTMFLNACVLIASATMWTDRPHSHPAAVATVVSGSALTVQVGVLVACGARRCRLRRSILVNPLANGTAPAAATTPHP